MKPVFTYLLSLLFIINTHFGSSQSKTVDSLNHLLSLAKTDTAKLDLYLKLCDKCDVKDNMKYAEPALDLATKLLQTAKDSLTKAKFLQRYLDASMIKESYYEIMEGNSSPAILKCKEQQLAMAEKYNALQMIAEQTISLANFYYNTQVDAMKKYELLLQGYRRMEQVNYKKGMSRFLVQLAYFFADQGDTTHAIDYMNQATEVEKQINDPERYLRGYYISATFYHDLKDYKRAAEYFQKGIEKGKDTKDDEQLIQLYSTFGEMYEDKKEYDSALICYDNAITLSKKISTFDGHVFMALLGRADVWAQTGKINKAIIEYNSLQKLSEQFPDIFRRTLFLHMGNTYFLTRQFDKAKLLADKALEVSYKMTFPSGIYEAEELVYKVDSALGNGGKAFQHYQKYMILKDQFRNTEVEKKAVQQKFQQQLKQQEEEQQARDTKAQVERKKQRLILYAVSIFLLLVVILAVVIFRSLRINQKNNKIISEQKQQVEQQKHLVEEKQKEILDSITYAKRLQQAILPPPEFITKNLPDNFVLYKPKDIVAGDFYWAEEIDTLLFIAAADSTGHGVPGAMVSVVCSNAINRAVKEFDLTDTGKILDKTRELVIETFAKSNAEVKDGMDISLLCIDKQNQKIFWSGANNPLWYVEDKELNEIKANKQPIGKMDNPKPFTTQELEYKTDTTFYLFTDGLADQFGGPNGKKFKYKQFEQLLVSINERSMQEQSDIIDKVFENWKGDLDQVDDVCVIGIKI